MDQIDEDQLVPHIEAVENVEIIYEEAPEEVEFYLGWDHFVAVYEFASWISLEEFLAVLRELRECKFFDASHREKALETLDSMGINDIVAPRRRFPDGIYYDLDCPEIVALINQVRFALSFEHAADMARSYDSPPRSYYIGALRTFYSVVNELHNYMSNNRNMWCREKFESYHYLEWTLPNHDVGVQVNDEIVVKLYNDEQVDVGVPVRV